MLPDVGSFHSTGMTVNAKSVVMKTGQTYGSNNLNAHIPASYAVIWISFAMPDWFPTLLCHNTASCNRLHVQKHSTAFLHMRPSGLMWNHIVCYGLYNMEVQDSYTDKNQECLSICSWEKIFYMLVGFVVVFVLFYFFLPLT